MRICVSYKINKEPGSNTVKGNRILNTNFQTVSIFREMLQVDRNGLISERNLSHKMMEQ